ncbi:MAG: delta-60 repeat domain-containing protein [Flavobacteriales bacterium]|nr:delta-60 repeat domain-containing protein [Flavobacteriales bacterium]
MSFNQLDDGTYGDGPLDYHLSYSGPSASVYEVFLLPDDRALIRGVFESYSGTTVNGPVVILPDGTLDPSYSLSIPQSFYPGRVARANEGGFLCAGTVAGGHTIRPLSLDGTLSAPLQVLVNNVIQVMLQLPDDRILIGGSFTEVNGQPKVRMARLHADGTVDTSFDIGAGFNGYVQCLLPLPNGGVVVGGSFTTVDNVARNGLALLSADGTLDMDFDPMSSALYPCTIGNLVLDADGRLLVGGAFQLAGPTIWSNLGRFLMNGQRDPDFSPGSGPSNNVAVIVPMDDGRIMIGGSFQAYDGTPRTSIARLFADGQMDPSFDVHIGHTLTPIVNRIRFTLQGDMIVTGRFSAVDGRMRMAITRLSIDGVPDPGFLPGRGVGGMVFSMAHMDDGRVAIAGDHLSYNGQHRPYLSFLDPEGELDAAFSGGSGPNGRVTRMVKLPGDRLFLAGDMTRYDSVPVPRMAVVDAHGQLDMSMMLPDIVAPGLMVSALGVANDGGVYVAIMPEQTFSGHPPRTVQALSERVGGQRVRTSF